MMAGYVGTTGARGPVIPIGVFDSLSSYFMRINADSASNTTQAVTLLRGPRDEVGPMQDYWNNAVPIGSKRNLYAGPDSGRGTWDSTQVPWDFRYPASHALYSSGSDGKPLGAVFIYGLTVNVARTEEVPPTFALAQNFPNPFNPSTMLEFTVPERMDVSLKIYSLLGQEVARARERCSRCRHASCDLPCGRTSQRNIFLQAHHRNGDPDPEDGASEVVPDIGAPRLRGHRESPGRPPAWSLMLSEVMCALPDHEYLPQHDRPLRPLAVPHRS